MRGERELVSHGDVDFPSAGAKKTFVRVYLDERSWLVGSFFVFFFLSSRRQQCAIGEKEQTKQREAKKILDQRRRGGIFLSSRKSRSSLFLFLTLPPFFLGWAYQEEKEFLVPFQKKAFDEKESTCTKQLDCPAAFSGPKSWFIIVHK